MPCPVCSNAFCSGGCGAPTRDNCTPGPGNAPVSDAQYQCSTGVRVQCSIDQARRQLHVQGLRPYRVYLIWQRRDRNQRFEEIRRLELIPVDVANIRNVDLQVEMSGRRRRGDLLLTQISPAQVNENDLIGRLDGSEPPDDTEFFYELIRHTRCPTGDEGIRAGRYTVEGLPEYDGTGFQWVVRISHQDNARLPEDTTERDRDTTHTPVSRRPQGAGIRW